MPARRGRAFLCDGILCDGFIWKYLFEDLANEANVTHWNYSGHGRSAAPNDPAGVGIQQCARDLTTIRNAIRGEAAEGEGAKRESSARTDVLFGHSMGCQVALEGWRTDPTRVGGIVLLCGTFGNVTSTFRGVPVLDMVLPKLLKAAEAWPDLLRAIWTRVPSETVLKMALKLGEVDPEHVRPEDFLPYLQHMTRVDPKLFLTMLRSAGDHSAGGYLGQIDVPVLIVAGERDTFTPSFLSDAMAKAIPNAELVVVPKATHCAPIEQPLWVWGKVRTFLRTKVWTDRTSESSAPSP